MTWLGVQPWNQPGITFTFQCQIFDDGTLLFVYDDDVSLVTTTIVGVTPGTTSNPGSTDFSAVLPFDSATDPTAFQRFVGGAGWDLEDFVLRFRPNGNGGWIVDDGCASASWSTFGSGCNPGMPLTLSNYLGDLPVLGETFQMLPTNLGNPSALAAMHLGLQQQSIELSIVGMPNCYILTTVEAALTPLFLIEGFPINFDVTNDASMLGTVFNAQLVVVSAGANALGVVTSNGGAMTFGY